MEVRLTVNQGVVGSNPTCAALCSRSSVGSEHFPHKKACVGSSPTGGTI